MTVSQATKIATALHKLRVSSSLVRQRIPGARTLLKIDAFGTHPVSQPVVLIEANARRKRQIGADAYEHPTTVLVVDVKVILHDPTLRQLQVPALLCPDGNHDPGRLPGFENDNHLIVLS
jgi:hypothetical protein